MAKMVGLSRTIKLPWLNKAAQLYQEHLPLEEYKAQMNEYLSFEIESAIVLRKTREILMNVWYYDTDPFITDLRKTAIVLLDKYPEEAVPIHWCLMLLSYPVMIDMSKLMGRLYDFSDTITLKQIKQKMFDEWGERATLFHTTDKIIATMKELGVISNVKVGTYTIQKHKIKADAVTAMVIQTALKTNNSSYCNFGELTDFNVMFPFEYTVSKEQLMADERFTLTTFGGEMTVTLK